MSEDIERAVGAGDPAATVVINGKQCAPRPLGVRELVELERVCLADFKRQYLKTYADNYDLMPNKKRRDVVIEEQFQRAAKWTVEDLPGRTVYDPALVSLTPKLRKRMETDFGTNGRSDESIRDLVAGALDGQMLSDADYRAMTGEAPPAVKVGYVNWWTSTLNGVAALVWIAFKDDGVTRDEVSKELSTNRTMVTELARRVEELSRPSAENG